MINASNALLAQIYENTTWTLANMKLRSLTITQSVELHSQSVYCDDIFVDEYPYFLSICHFPAFIVFNTEM